MRTTKNKTFEQSGKQIRLKTSVSAVAVLLSLLLFACGAAPMAATPAVTDAPVSPSAASSEASVNLSLSSTTPVSDDAKSPTIEGAGFAAPEDTVKEYLEGLKNADFNRMVSAFAVESYVENYSIEAMLNRIKAYTPAQEIKLPNTNEFVTAMNIESRRSRVTNSILQQYLVLSNSELDSSQPIMMEDEKIVSEFVTQLNNNLDATELQTLKIIGFIKPEDITELYASEQNQANIARQAAIYAAERQVSCVAAFELGGNNYLLCYDAVEYGGKWYIAQFGGNIGALLGLSNYSMGLAPLGSGEFDEFNELITPMKK